MRHGSALLAARAGYPDATGAAGAQELITTLVMGVAKASRIGDARYHSDGNPIIRFA
jgi:hypothetical protein